MFGERDFFISDEYNEVLGLKDFEFVIDLKYRYKWNSRYYWIVFKEFEIFFYDLLVFELW